MAMTMMVVVRMKTGTKISEKQKAPRLSDEALREKIKANTEITPEGCWRWMKSLGSHGYGNIGTGGSRNETAHRVSLEVFKGPIPEGMMALHSCGNRWCCNPDHLRPGTTKENIEDAKKDGTWKGYPLLRGSRHPGAKFNETTALEAYRDQRSIKDIAATYGVSVASVRALKGGKTWQHVTSAAKVAGLNTTAIPTAQD